MIDDKKLIEWIYKYSWTGDSDNNAQDEVLVVDADDLVLAIANKEFEPEQSEDVKMAIEYLEPISEHPIMTGMYSKHLKIAIQALKQMMPKEKCEWCDKMKMWLTPSGKYIPEYQPPTNFCPNCGRELVKE